MPDNIIADWVMPIFRRPGTGANDPPARRQRQSICAIIMLTGHSEKKRIVNARDAGITEFLAKPISAKSLYERILNVVANPRPFIKSKNYFGRTPGAISIELCRAGTAQRRQGGGHSPTAVAR